MGSYVAFYLAGMYPLPATRQFLLSSPYFPSISFKNPVFGNATTIKVKNFSGNPNSWYWLRPSPITPGCVAHQMYILRFSMHLQVNSIPNQIRKRHNVPTG